MKATDTVNCKLVILGKITASATKSATNCFEVREIIAYSIHASLRSEKWL
jgi:hypothetical protein